MTAQNRADPFNGDLDLSDFKPAPIPKKPAVEKEAIREVSEATGFPSRAPERAPTVAKPVVQRRRRTGRNAQLNVKATPETIARFTAIADRHGLVFGELLERALDAFERESP